MINDYIMVGIDIDTATNVLCELLKQQYLDLSPNIGGCPMFSYDKEENNLQFYELKKAFQLVMDYNGCAINDKGEPLNGK